MVRRLLLGALTLWAAAAAAINTDTAIFDSRFQTLTVQVEDAFMMPDVVRLGTNDRLIISFDEIGDDYSELRYRLVHCNADWQPSRLQESEFVDGFNEGIVEDYAFSTNTYVHYVNYRIVFPNEQVVPLVSGNYLLQVFPQDEPSQTLLQARVAVAETAVTVTPRATSRTDRGFNTEYQQVEFTINQSAFPVGNPYQDLAVTVEQNRTPESMRTVSHPMRVEGNSIVFSHDQNLIFNASNEFRRFETVRVDLPGMHTDSVTWGGTNYHAWLTADEPRYESSYIYDSTQQGRFMIDEYYASDPSLGADYVTVHFTLQMPEMPGYDIFVDGDLTRHSRDARYRMAYDHSDGAYHLQLPLKQGSYNYQYVMRPPGGKTPASPSPIEGDKYETRNEYLIKVFHRPPGARADRLIGFAFTLPD